MKKQNQSDFVSNCVNSFEMKKLFPDESERARVCTQRFINHTTGEWAKSLFDGADICPGCGGMFSYAENGDAYCSSCDDYNGPRGDINAVNSNF